MKKELIHLQGVSKSFDGHLVLDGLDLTIYENEFVTLLGAERLWQDDDTSAHRRV